MGALFICGIVACAQQNLDVQKKQGEALRAVGEAYMAEGNYREALKSLLDADKLYPNDPYLQNDIGLVYLAMKKPDLSVTHFKKAVALKPDYAPAINNLGTAYMENGDLDAAIASFKEASENLLYATPHYPLLNLGEIYFIKKDYAAAAAYFQKVLDHYRDGYAKDAAYAKALRGLGRTSMAMRNTAKAIEFFEKGIRIAPRLEPMYLDLANAYEAAGERNKALKTYERLLRISPDGLFSEQAAKEADRLKQKMGN